MQHTPLDSSQCLPPQTCATLPLQRPPLPSVNAPILGSIAATVSSATTPAAAPSLLPPVAAAAAAAATTAHDPRLGVVWREADMPRHSMRITSAAAAKAVQLYWRQWGGSGGASPLLNWFATAL